MTIFTYNNLLRLFELFTEAHYQLKRYGNGELADIEELISDAQTFPILWSNLIDIQYPLENRKQYNFNILIFDILKNDKSNEQEVWSDSIQIAEDFVRFLNHNATDKYEVIGTPIINTFTERFTDFVAGCNLNITIELDSVLQSDCGIPMDEFDYEIPSFIPTASTETTFNCDDLLDCPVFTSLSAQTEQNTIDIFDLSGRTLTGNYLPLSGGTVSGATFFTSGVTSNQFQVNSFNTISINNSLDTNTGIMWDGPDVLSFHNGGRQSILINAAGAITNGGLISSGFQTELTGNTRLHSVSATTLSAATIFSGSTSLANIFEFQCIQRTGSTISFDKPATYGTITAASTGNITGDYTDARLGVVQLLIHSGTTIPTIPATWQISSLSDTYTTGVTNTIYIEWLESEITKYIIAQ